MIRRILPLLALCAVVLVSWPGESQAQKCDTVGVYGAIALVVCPKVSDAVSLEQAGRDACDPINVRGVCNAWIWSREDRAARSLPMTERQLASVTALWINKQARLKVCARDGCYAGQR